VESLTDVRGTYEVLEDCEGFRLRDRGRCKSQRLSLQSHSKRSEHWVITSGRAVVTVDDTEIPWVDEYIHIPVGLSPDENPGTEPLIFVEVQLGAYLGEDDIIAIRMITSALQNNY